MSAGDGDLADDWAVMASATPMVPPASACYDAPNQARNAYAPRFNVPVACTGSHGVETFHVGQLPASVTLPPTDGDPDHLQAFAECEKQAKTFLGGDWFNARLYLVAFVPSKQQWDAGGRWYACQLMETTQLTTTNVVQRTGSLKDSLTNATGPLVHRCTNVIGLKDDDWDDMVGIDCGQPHDAEFAGAFKVPGMAFPKSDAQFESVLDECWNVVARFAGAKVDDIQMGYIPWGLVEKDWNRGHRYVRCFAWSDKKKTTGSMKGIGGKAPA